MTTVFSFSCLFACCWWLAIILEKSEICFTYLLFLTLLKLSQAYIDQYTYRFIMLLFLDELIIVVVHWFFTVNLFIFLTMIVGITMYTVVHHGKYILSCLEYDFSKIWRFGYIELKLILLSYLIQKYYFSKSWRFLVTLNLNWWVFVYFKG